MGTAILSFLLTFTVMFFFLFSNFIDSFFLNLGVSALASIVLFVVCLLLLMKYGQGDSSKEKAPESTPLKEKAPDPAPIGPWPPAPPMPAAPAQTSEEGRREVRHITDMVYALQNPAVKKEAQDCAVLCAEILDAAEQSPKAKAKLSNFYNHYLPMFEQMLENYRKCEAAGVLPASVEQELTQFLDVMESAMKKLKETLYAADVDRLAVDMDVLETLYRSDGLLEDELLLPEKKGQ